MKSDMTNTVREADKFIQAELAEKWSAVTSPSAGGYQFVVTAAVRKAEQFIEPDHSVFYLDRDTDNYVAVMSAYNYMRLTIPREVLEAEDQDLVAAAIRTELEARIDDLVTYHRSLATMLEAQLLMNGQ